MTVSSVGYLIAALAFTALAFVAIAGWRGGPRAAALLVALLVTVAWAAYLGYAAVPAALEAPASIVLFDAVRMAVWLVWLLELVRPSVRSRSARIAYAVGHVTWMSLVAACAHLQLSGRAIDAESLPALGFLLVALVSLIALDQALRRTPATGVEGAQLFSVAMGGLIAVDLVLYGQVALTERSSEVVWGGRGYLYALTVPVLALAIRRNPAWSLDIFVSRHVLYYSTALVAAAGYLLAVAMIVRYARAYFTAANPYAQIAFVVVALAVLVAVFSSAQLRSRVRVFIGKHFYRHKYEYRDEWLRLIRTLAQSEEPLPLVQRAIKAITAIVGGSKGLLWLRSQQLERFDLEGTWNVVQSEPARVPTDGPLVAFQRKTGWVLDTQDPSDRRYIDNDPQLRALSFSQRILFVPLIHGSEQIGLVAVECEASAPPLNYEDHDLLKTVGRQVASYLSEERANRQLEEARRFEAFNQFTAFVIHDLKTLVTQQSLLLRNAAKHRHDPRFIDDALQTVDNSIRRMNKLLQQLGGRQTSTPAPVLLSRTLQEVLASCVGQAPVPELLLHDSDIKVHADPDGLATALGHLIRNAQQATSPDGHVAVALKRAGDCAIIDISDTGAGMDAAFLRDRLFRPFETTKGARGMGIGAYQARMLVRQMNGEINVRSSPGVGTTVSVQLPLCGK